MEIAKKTIWDENMKKYDKIFGRIGIREVRECIPLSTHTSQPKGDSSSIKEEGNLGGNYVSPGGRKGFVLTFDATIAVSIAIIMAVAIVGIISAKSYDMRLPHSIAEDLLSAMDASGELQKYAGYSSQQIQQSMQSALQVLPKNLCGNMTISIYDANDFNKVNTYNANTCQTIAESTNAKRIFADYTKEKFGIIELSVRL